MTTQRKDEIKKEAMKRVHLWLIHSTFEEMTAGESFIRFDMSLGLLGGYPFKLESWMKEKDFSDFVTLNEFNSEDYDDILKSLFMEESMRNEIQKEKNKN